MTEGMPIEGDEHPVKRGPGRPPLRRTETLRPEPRSDSVREAEEYAARLMDQIGTDTFEYDEFHIPRDEWPEGWIYEWKAIEVIGKENRGHMLGLLKNGWRAVDAERHPYKMPAGYSGPIVIKGLGLYELPEVLVNSRKKAEKYEARDMIKNSEAQLYETPANTAPRDHESVERRGLNKVTRDYVSPKTARVTEED